MAEKKVALVIGASRGMGRQIAITLADAGYTVVVAAKSTADLPAGQPFPPDPNTSQSTAGTVAREIAGRGGTATAAGVDVRSSESINALFAEVRQQHGRLDALVYNAGAIWWAPVADTPLKRYALMQSINADGLYAAVQAALPLFAAGGWRARVVVVSPPIYSRFFRGKTAYAMGKVAMSVLTKGLAMDWERDGRADMAVTSLWPAAAISSAATSSAESQADLRRPEIFADAVLAVINAPADRVNGLLDLDEDFLRRECGVKDFAKYSMVEGATPRRIMPAEFPDLSVREQNDEGHRMNSAAQRGQQSKL